MTALLSIGLYVQPTPAPVPPTPPPTGSPTMVLYIQHVSGICVSDATWEMPHYIKETYTNFDDCCEASHNKEACLASAPTHTPTTSYPTITPAPTTYYPTATGTVYYVEQEV